MARPIILTLLPHYLPGFKAGGPIRTVSNMVDLLSDRFDFRIVTSDRDYGDAEPFPGIAPDTWIDTGRERRYYADAAHRTLRSFARRITEVGPDVVYLNSLFDATFSIAPLLARRLGMVGAGPAWVIAPRGECSRGAMALKAPKKRLFLGLARLLGLHRGLTWQASSVHEAEDIRRELGVDAGSIVVAPNPTESAGAFVAPESVGTEPPPLEICFLSRVSPKKNLAFALEALAAVRVPVRFHVYGPVEDGEYAAECRRIEARCPPHVAVTWHGEVAHENVRPTIARHHLFLFPTGGENFGHVIFEALAAGVPVLVSDRTPWRDLDEQGIGWVRTLDDPSVFADVIDRYAAVPRAERERIAARAHAYARSVACSPAVLDANQGLFERAISARVRRG